MARRLLLLLVGLQILTHLFWLSLTVHSGQVAIPWMMNRGLTLFGEIWEQHAPGSSLLGAAAQRFLPLDPGLLAKLLNTLLVVALTALIFQVAARLSGSSAAGLLAAAFWAWWEPVYGNVMLYFDTLLAFCVLAALLVYYHRGEGPSLRQISLIGLLMGAATLFKQQAWLAVLILGIWLLTTDRRSRTLLLYIAAALALPLLQWILLAAQGNWDAYLFWNWTFNLGGYMDGLPLDGDFFRKLLFTNLLVLPYALIACQRAGRRPLLIVFMWLATLSVLYPRVGEIHVMGHLPFTAVMSGIVLAKALPLLRDAAAGDLPRKILAGLAMGIALGWLWTGAASYLHMPLGPGGILAYEEFHDLAGTLQARSAPGDTLFVLPETDSSPQLHPLTDMPPPGVWIKGWRWYFRPDHVLPALLREWKTMPPTWIVVFPDLIRSDNVGVTALLDIVDERYLHVFDSAEIYGHGSAAVYKLADESE